MDVDNHIFTLDKVEDIGDEENFYQSEYDELLACRVCLATDTKLISIHEFQLGESFENNIGYTVAQDDGFPQYLCHYCCTLLAKFESFKAKYERAQFILTSALVENQEITTEYLRNLDRKANELAYPLEVTKCAEPIEVKHRLPLLKIPASKLKKIPNEQIVVQKVEMDGENIIRVFYLSNDEQVESTQPAIVQVKDEKVDAEHAPEIVQEDVEDEQEEEEEEEDISRRRKRIESHPNVEIQLLSKAEQMEEFANRVNKVGYRSAFLKCDICYRGFLLEKSYTAHMMLHSPEYGDFQCSICSIRCESASRLRTHARAAHQRRYRCKECGRHDVTAKAARQHQAQHDGETFDCDFCGQVFRSQSALSRHQYSQHKEGKSQMVLNQSSGVMSQNPAKRRTCDSCNIVFSSVNAYNVHLVTNSSHQNVNGSDWESCKHCGQSFETKEILRAHSENHKQAFKCDQCDISFMHERGLAIHRGQAHKNFILSDMIKNICQYCGREFESGDDLAQHKLTHSGEKPFECKVCKKCFKLPTFLQTHLRIHSKEAPYSCQICQRKFSHKANLNRHYKVHTGDKPYICNICNNGFTQSNSLKLHIKTVHMKLPDPYRHNRTLKKQQKKLEKALSKASESSFFTEADMDGLE